MPPACYNKMAMNKWLSLQWLAWVDIDDDDGEDDIMNIY